MKSDLNTGQSDVIEVMPDQVISCSEMVSELRNLRKLILAHANEIELRQVRMRRVFGDWCQEFKYMLG